MIAKRSGSKRDGNNQSLLQTPCMRLETCMFLDPNKLKRLMLYTAPRENSGHKKPHGISPSRATLGTLLSWELSSDISDSCGATTFAAGSTAGSRAGSSDPTSRRSSATERSADALSRSLPWV